MIGKRRRERKPGPKPLLHELKLKRITITLAKYHKQVTVKSPRISVDECISLARYIAQAQCSQLVDVHLATGKTAGKLVHEAMKGYLASPHTNRVT